MIEVNKAAMMLRSKDRMDILCEARKREVKRFRHARPAATMCVIKTAKRDVLMARMTLSESPAMEAMESGIS